MTDYLSEKKRISGIYDDKARKAEDKLRAAYETDRVRLENGLIETRSKLYAGKNAAGAAAVRNIENVSERAAGTGLNTGSVTRAKRALRTGLKSELRSLSEAGERAEADTAAKLTVLKTKFDSDLRDARDKNNEAREKELSALYSSYLKEREKAEKEAQKALQAAEKERIAAEKAAEKERLAAEKAAEKERLAAEKAAEKARKEAEKASGGSRGGRKADVEPERSPIDGALAGAIAGAEMAIGRKTVKGSLGSYINIGAGNQDDSEPTDAATQGALLGAEKAVEAMIKKAKADAAAAEIAGKEAEKRLKMLAELAAKGAAAGAKLAVQGKRSLKNAGSSTLRLEEIK